MKEDLKQDKFQHFFPSIDDWDRRNINQFFNKYFHAKLMEFKNQSIEDKSDILVSNFFKDGF